MNLNTFLAVVIVAFFSLLGGLMYAQHTEIMACTQAGIKADECKVLK